MMKKRLYLVLITIILIGHHRSQAGNLLTMEEDEEFEQEEITEELQHQVFASPFKYLKLLANESTTITKEEANRLAIFTDPKIWLSEVRQMGLMLAPVEDQTNECMYQHKTTPPIKKLQIIEDDQRGEQVTGLVYKDNTTALLNILTGKDQMGPTYEIDLKTGQKKSLFSTKFEGDGRCFAYSDVCKLMLIVSSSNHIDLHDTGGKKVGTLDKHVEPIGALAVNPCEAFAISSSKNETILWDLLNRTGKLLQYHDGSFISQPTFNSTGKFIAITGDSEDAIHLFDTTGKLIKKRINLNMVVGEKQITSDGQTIVFTGYSRKTKKMHLYIWKRLEKDSVSQLTNICQIPHLIRLLDDDRLIVGDMYAGNIHLVNLKTAQIQIFDKPHEHAAPPTVITLVPDDKNAFAVGSDEGWLAWYEAKNKSKKSKKEKK